jgi:hypothetical protein
VTIWFAAAFAVVVVGAWFVWAAYSRAARTRTLQVVGLIVSLALINLLLGFRIASSSAVSGGALDSSDIVAAVIMNVGAVAGTVAGAMVRDRSE